MQAAIGLEVHIRLHTRTKMFCRCRSCSDAPSNTHICPTCMGYPGSLPTINREALRQGYLLASALGCHLSEQVSFDRKSYIYPDLPKNYQITQYFHPLGVGGALDISDGRGGVRTVRLRRIHIEEDAGKMLHTPTHTLLDLNRAGMPLVEVVTEPELRQGEEAELFVKELQTLVRDLEVSLARMEEGELRCDSNVSLSPRDGMLGSRVEIKNLNSTRFVRKAIDYELRRHQMLLTNGKQVEEEVLLWDETKGKTKRMRLKKSEGYHYFPDPDLPPFVASEEILPNEKEITTPLMRRKAFEVRYGLLPQNTEQLLASKELTGLFEEVVALGIAPPIASSWVLAEVRGHRRERPKGSLLSMGISAEVLAKVISLVEEGKVSRFVGQDMLCEIVNKGTSIESLIERGEHLCMVDQDALEAIIQRLLASHRSLVEEIKSGVTNKMGYLVGQVMRETQRRADPRLVQKILRQHFDP